MNQTPTSQELILPDFWAFLKKPTHLPQQRVFSLSLAFKLFISFFIIRLVGILLEIKGFHPFVFYLTGQEIQKQQHPDFYGSCKGCEIFFFIFPSIPDDSENAVDDLVSHRVQN